MSKLETFRGEKWTNNLSQAINKKTYIVLRETSLLSSCIMKHALLIILLFFLIVVDLEVAQLISVLIRGHHTQPIPEIVLL